MHSVGFDVLLTTGNIHIDRDNSVSKISYMTPKHLLAKARHTQYETILRDVPLWRNPRL